MPFFLLNASKRLSSVAFASSGCVCGLRKCVHPRNLVSPLCVRSLERIHDSLLPMYRTILPSALPISYTPDWFKGNTRTSFNLKGIHLLLIGIFGLLVFLVFYTLLMIDNNIHAMLTLAKKLGVKHETRRYYRLDTRTGGVCYAN